MYKGFWCGNLRDKRPLGRLGIRWEDNIKMDLQEVGWRGMETIDMTQDRYSGRHL